MKKICLLLSFVLLLCASVTDCSRVRFVKNEENSESTEKVPDIKVSFSVGECGYVSMMSPVGVEVKADQKVKLKIDWGDGSTLSDITAGKCYDHRYSKGGDYTVSLSSGSFSEEWTLSVGGIPALCEAVPALEKSNVVWCMSHRAHTSDPTVPENSIASVNAAIEAGADVLETDTHITSDGEVVICHDQTINATTNGKGDITQMTLAQIKSFNLTDRKGKVTEEKMPTLEEFLLAARGRVYVNLDYSPRTAPTEAVWEIVEKLGMVQEVFMYCNTAEKIEEVYSCNPEANAYCRVDYYSTLTSGPNKYFVQARWKPGRPSDVIRDMENTAQAVRTGCLSSVNMLHVNDSRIPEYTVGESYLTDLLDAYPHCHMIMNDCPDILVPMLERKGRR